MLNIEVVLKSIRTNKGLFAFILFVIWCAIFMKGMLYHEMWRDEMRALSIAIEAPDFFSLPLSLKNEGHPLLWYFLLKVSYSIFQTTLVLPLLSYSFAAGIAYYMLFKSPFPLVFSAALIFGFWGMYEYGIVCRNYGLAAFFMLAFADSFKKRPPHILKSCLFLGLAIQSNFYATVFGGLLLLYLFLELKKDGLLTIKNSFYLLIPLLSIVLSIIVCWPDKSSLVSHETVFYSKQLADIWKIGYGFQNLFFYWFTYTEGFVTFILFLSTFMFLKNGKAFLLYAFSLFFISYFARHFYLSRLHHVGMWVYFTVVLLWINYKQLKHLLSTRSIYKYLILLGLLSFLLIIANNYHRGRYLLRDDIRALKSDSKNAAAKIKSLNKDILLLAEPDYILESVMYYNYKPFYIPREKRANTYTHFTKENAAQLSLSEIMHAADSFEKAGRPTVLIFAYPIGHKDSIHTYSYNKTFTYNRSEVEQFHQHYKLLDSANQSWYYDERYYLYMRRQTGH